MDKLTCPVCGEPTRVYMGNARKDRLCGKHADELKAGNIEIFELAPEDKLQYPAPVFIDVKTHAILNKNINSIPPSLYEKSIYWKANVKAEKSQNKSNSTPPLSKNRLRTGNLKAAAI